MCPWWKSCIIDVCDLSLTFVGHHTWWRICNHICGRSDQCSASLLFSKARSFVLELFLGGILILRADVRPQKKTKKLSFYALGQPCKHGDSVSSRRLIRAPNALCHLCHSLHWDVYAFGGFLRGTHCSRSLFFHTFLARGPSHQRSVPMLEVFTWGTSPGDIGRSHPRHHFWDPPLFLCKHQGRWAVVRLMLPDNLSCRYAGSNDIPCSSTSYH